MANDPYTDLEDEIYRGIAEDTDPRPVEDQWELPDEEESDEED